MVTGVFDFHPTFRFITPNKDERRDAYAPWINPPTPEEDVKIIVVASGRKERKETWQLVADQAGEQHDRRSTQKLYSSHVQVNSSSLGRAVVAGIEVLRAERRMLWCSIGSSLPQGSCFHHSLHLG